MRFVRASLKDECFYAEYVDNTLRPLKGAPWTGIVYDGREFGVEECTLLSPCEPTKCVCVGKNYWEHAEEMKEGHPAEPVLFLKPSTCVVGPEAEVKYPNISNRLDYEGEIAAVIGKAASHISAADAKDYIFGYTCANDVTARDIQKSDMQWTRGKCFDTFCPLGPWIETQLDPTKSEVETRLNGVRRQYSSTGLMTHGVYELVEYISACMTLLPGDVILTGTPAGVAPMQRGDTVEVEITGIGILRNRVI